MKKFFFLTFSWLSLCVNGQQWLWAYPINTKGMAWVMSIQTDSLGNPTFTGLCDPDTSIFYGTNGSVSKNNLGSFVAKYDASGNIDWIAGGWGKSVYVNSSDIDSQGNTYLTGYFSDHAAFGINNDTIGTDASTQDYFLCKLDRFGRAAYLKTSGGSCNDEGLSVTTMSSDKIMNCWVDVTFCYYAGGYDTHLEERDPLGGIIRSFPLPFDVLDNQPKYITSTKDSGFLFCNQWFGDKDICFQGNTDSICLAPTYPSGNTDVFLVKYSLNGDILWGKTVRGSGNQYPRYIAVDKMNNILLAIGGLGITYFDSTALLTEGTRTTYLIKSDPQGNILNYIGFNNSYSPMFEIFDLKTDQSGNIYLLVKNDSDFFIDQDTIRFNLSSSQTALTVMKLTPALNYIWSQYVVVGGNDGGTIAVTDSIIYIGVHHDVPAYLNGSTYQFAAPSNPSANVFFAAIKNTSSPLSEVEGQVRSARVYPNPSQGVFTITSNSNLYKLAVSDLCGHCIFKKESKCEKTIEVDLKGQPKGIYFLELSSDHGRSVQKIIVE